MGVEWIINVFLKLDNVSLYGHVVLGVCVSVWWNC